MRAETEIAAFDDLGVAIRYMKAMNARKDNKESLLYIKTSAKSLLKDKIHTSEFE